MHRSSQFSQILRTVPTDADQLALVVSHDAGTLSRLQGSFLLRNLGTEDQVVSFWTSEDPRRTDFTGSTPQRAAFTELVSQGITIPPGVTKSVLINASCSFFGISVVSETAANPPNLQVTGTVNHGYTVNQDGIQARLRDPDLETYFSSAAYTGYSVTGTPLVLDPGVVSMTLLIPSGTSATVNDGTNNVVYAGGTTPTVIISANGLTFTNTFTITRSAGSGTISVSVTR